MDFKQKKHDQDLIFPLIHQVDLITGVSVYASTILRNDIYTTENLIMNNFYRLEAYFFKLIVQYFS